MIGIFGGTFDPVHKAHLQIAQDAQQFAELSEVRFIPLHHAVHREQPIANAGQRVAMLNMAIKAHPSFSVDLRELERQGDSYMIDTLTSLKQDFPDESLCLLMGGDAFEGFPKWKSPDNILNLCNILVMQRPGHKPAQNPLLHRLLEKHESSIETFKASPSNRICIQDVTPLEISSSQVRTDIKAGADVQLLVPVSVSKYIQQQQLYR